MVCPACLVALAGTDGIGGFEPTPAELYGTPVALAALGAGLGALIDKKNRKRGTLIGLLSGAAIGVGASVMMASMSAKPAAASSSQTQNAATADQAAPITGFAAQKKKKLRALTPTQTTTSVVTSGSADPNDILMNYKPPATVAPPPINYVR